MQDYVCAAESFSGRLLGTLNLLKEDTGQKTIYTDYSCELFVEMDLAFVRPGDAQSEKSELI